MAGDVELSRSKIPIFPSMEGPSGNLLHYVVSPSTGEATEVRGKYW